MITKILTPIVIVTLVAISATVMQNSATPLPSPPASGAVVHSETNVLKLAQADNGKTVKLPSGSLLVLTLSSPPNWVVRVGDKRILKVAPDALKLYPHAQGIFRGAALGATLLEAFSDYPCMHVQPRCLMPSFVYRVKVVVVRSIDEETRRYWTPERMRNAKPMPMPHPTGKGTAY